MITNTLEYLENTAKTNPNKIALKDANGEITYNDLIKKAKTIGTYIASHTHMHNRPIAVCIDRNIQSIILFLGIVYSGNFYVPLDTNMPYERVKMILEELNPKLILASVTQSIDGYDTIPFEEVTAGEIDEEALKDIRNRALDTDPLYAIYTSGSTGKPKGVLVCHRSVVDLVEQFGMTFPFPEEPIFGNQAPFDFDVSVKDIYNSIRLGGTLYVIPKQCFSMPLQLIDTLNREKINTIIWAVSALRIVENFKTFAKAVPKYLKLIMFSGEIMPVKVLNYWKSETKDAVYVNLYGPTEITCNCTYHIITREFAQDESIPIGIPFKNTEILLMDLENKNRIEESNIQGEICVRGTCLAHGYYKEPDKTDAAFVQNPLHSDYPEKIYRTGDMGYYNERKELCFASRRDYQIKHMGHRIELGEIEVVVNSVDGVDAGVCVFDETREKIVLFYQLSKDDLDKESEIKKKIIEKLRNKLPKFMWPNRYLCYNELPLNKNGKIDRVKLKASLEEE